MWKYVWFAEASTVSILFRRLGWRPCYLLLWQASFLLTPRPRHAFQESRHPSRCCAIDFRVTWRRTDERGDEKAQSREMRRAPRCCASTHSGPQHWSFSVSMLTTSAWISLPIPPPCSLHSPLPHPFWDSLTKWKCRFSFLSLFFFFWGIMWSTLDNEMRSSNTPCLVITGAGTNQILSLADRFSSLAIN